jgi:hypothetical protein
MNILEQISAHYWREDTGAAKDLNALADGIEALPIQEEEVAPDYVKYSSNETDTVYSLSKKLGITPGDIQDMNPSMESFRGGDELFISDEKGLLPDESKESLQRPQDWRDTPENKERIAQGRKPINRAEYDTPLGRFFGLDKEGNDLWDHLRVGGALGIIGGAAHKVTKVMDPYAKAQMLKYDIAKITSKLKQGTKLTPKEDRKILELMKDFYEQQGKKALKDAKKTAKADAKQEKRINSGKDAALEEKMRLIEEKHGIKPASNKNKVSEDVIKKTFDQAFKGLEDATTAKRGSFDIESGVNDTWIQKQIDEGINQHLEKMKRDLKLLNGEWVDSPEFARPDSSHIQSQIDVAIDEFIAKEKEMWRSKSQEWIDRTLEELDADEGWKKKRSKGSMDTDISRSSDELDDIFKRISEESTTRSMKDSTRNIIGRAHKNISANIKTFVSPRANLNAARAGLKGPAGGAGGVAAFVYSLIGLARAMEDTDLGALDIMKTIGNIPLVDEDERGYVDPDNILWFREWVKGTGLMLIGGQEAYDNMTVDNLLYFVTASFNPVERIRIIKQIPKSLKDMFVEPLLWLFEQMEGYNTPPVTPMNAIKGQSTPQGQWPPSVQQ